MYLIYNIQLSYLIVIGLMAISLIKVLLVKGGGNKLKLKPFELPDTMPLRGIMACLIIVTHVSYKYGVEQKRNVKRYDIKNIIEQWDGCVDMLNHNAY